MTTRADEPKPAAHALTDLSGRFLSVDDGFCALVRRDRRNIVGRTILELTAERDRPLNARKLDLLRNRGEPFVIRKTYLCGDGGRQAVENSVSLLTDGSGGSVLSASVGILSDVPDRRFAAAIRTASALLEERRARAVLGVGFGDRDWTLLLAAYLLEAQGDPGWATSICEAAGGDARANLLRVWELIHAGVLVLDGKATSLEQASVRVSVAHTKTLEGHLADVLSAPT